MENININELRALWKLMDTTGVATSTFEDFIQERIDTFRDDWYMYRPIVKTLEKRVAELEHRIELINNLN